MFAVSLRRLRPLEREHWSPGNRAWTPQLHSLCQPLLGGRGISPIEDTTVSVSWSCDKHGTRGFLCLRSIRGPLRLSQTPLWVLGIPLRVIREAPAGVELMVGRAQETAEIISGKYDKDSGAGWCEGEPCRGERLQQWCPWKTSQRGVTFDLRPERVERSGFWTDQEDVQRPRGRHKPVCLRH